MSEMWEGLIESIEIESGPVVQFDEDGFTVDFTNTDWEEVAVVILDDNFDEEQEGRARE